MKPSSYTNFCLKVFGKFFTKHMEHQLEEKNLELVKADIHMSYEEYYSTAIMSMLISLIVSFVFSMVLYLLFPGLLTKIIFVLVPLLTTIIVGATFLYYPNYSVNKRGKNIDLFLPYAINFISSMAVAGISPSEIFTTLASVPVYGEVQQEAKKIAKEIAIMGTDNITALKHAIEISPSRKFKAFLQGIIGTIQSGSELHIFLGNVAKKYMEDDLTDRKKDLDLLSVIAEVLVLSVIAFPIFLVIILTVFGFFGGSMDSSLAILLVFSLFTLPIIYAMFYLLIKSTSIERITKVEVRKQTMKDFYKDNKKPLFILFVSAIIVAIVFGIILVLVNLEYIEVNIYLYWDFAFISFLILTGPIGIYKYMELKTKKDMQTRLPEFLTEVSDSLATGMNIFDAIKKSEKGHYGKLDPEIKKMKNQISWNVTVKNVLFDFADRMKSAIVHRIILVIDKGIIMGGNTHKIFKAAAQEVDQVNQIEYQRRSNMSLYALVMIVCFAVFLAIMIILNTTIFAEFLKIQNMQIADASGVLQLSTVNPTYLDYTLYTFVFVQSIGSGLLAGFMMDGKLSSGIRFSLILGIITIVIFKFLF